MTPDPAEVMDASSAYQAGLNRRVPGFDGLVESDVTLSAIGLPIARLNAASGARFTRRTANARIDEVIAWFEARRLPFVWRLGPADQPADLKDRLLARGFATDPEEMPGMVARLDGLPALELPTGAVVERVRDPGTFRVWLDVVIAGFEMPAPMGEAFQKFSGLGFGPDIPTLLLARLDGRPVAAALAAMAGGGVLISNVTTLPDVRGQGIGRAITLAAMRHGAEAGAAIAVLLASAMGHGIYRRLGFEDFGWYRTVVWSRG